MPKTPEELADEHVEAVLRKEFEAEVANLERKLEEMEEILGPLPELRKDLEELKKDPKSYYESRK